MEGSTSASGAPIANATSVSTGAMINPASTARKRAQSTLQMQLVIVSFMNQTGIWLAAGGEGLDPRLDHETQNRARS